MSGNLGDRLWTGLGRYMVPVPGLLWKRQIRGRTEHIRTSLAFMTDEHHRVREYAVRELPRQGTALSPDLIAGDLDLPAERIEAILADLEEHLTFIHRDAAGSVEWAYPVTVHPTPHEVTFSTGERLYSA